MSARGRAGFVISPRGVRRRWIWMSLVVPEMACIPKDYILAVNRLAIDEFVYARARQSRIGREPLAVIDFVAVIS